MKPLPESLWPRGKMTAEEAQQAETVARIRKERTAIGRDFDECEQLEEAKDYDRLLEIVDSQAQKIEAMQKQLNAYSLMLEAAGSLMQKQYTEEELRAEFEDNANRDPVHAGEIERFTSGEYKYKITEIGWHNFMRCARFLGAIKEKEK